MFYHKFEVPPSLVKNFSDTIFAQFIERTPNQEPYQRLIKSVSLHIMTEFERLVLLLRLEDALCGLFREYCEIFQDVGGKELEETAMEYCEKNNYSITCWMIHRTFNDITLLEDFFRLTPQDIENIENTEWLAYYG